MVATVATDTRRLVVEAGPDEAGIRLDRWLAGKCAELSRGRVQDLIRDGFVSSGVTIRDVGTPVKPGAIYTIDVPEAEDTTVVGENIALVVVYEDNDVIVIDKPAGLVVHPAAGHATGTLVNALIDHCGQSLSGVGGVKRPGIVHRLDKDTSGLLVVAKNDAAHQSLSDQFKSHGLDGRLHRAYVALAWGVPVRSSGTIDAPLSRSTSNRKKIAVVREGIGRDAVTHYEVIETFADTKGAPAVSLMQLVLETGRTHQIRVHLAHIRHPILGDTAYGNSFKTAAARLTPDGQSALVALGRQALHAATLEFEHPRTGKKMSFSSDVPQDMAALIAALRGAIRGAPATEKRPRRRSER